jgi:hypothetical protein
MFEQVIRYNLVWGSLHLINGEAVYEKRINCTKPVYSYTSITCYKISNIPYKLNFTTKFNDSSILITIISCDYLNLSLANEYVGDVTIPTQVIKYNQNFLQADQAIRLKYSIQIKLLSDKSACNFNIISQTTIRKTYLDCSYMSHQYYGMLIIWMYNAAK